MKTSLTAIHHRVVITVVMPVNVKVTSMVIQMWMEQILQPLKNTLEGVDFNDRVLMKILAVEISSATAIVMVLTLHCLSLILAGVALAIRV